MSAPPIIPAINDVAQLLVAINVNIKHIAATINSSRLGQNPHSVEPFPLGIEFFQRYICFSYSCQRGLAVFFFLGIRDYFQSAERGKRSCVHSSAIPRRIARRIAVVRRDRAAHPPRTDHPPAQHGT